MNSNTVSAKTVRAYFKEHPERVVALTDENVTESDLWRNINGRGKLHPNVIKGYSKATRGKRVYDTGVMDNKRVVLRGPKGRKIVVDTATLRALDGTEGKRGRISEATKQAYLASL